MATAEINGRAVFFTPPVLLTALLGGGFDLPCAGAGKCGRCRVTARGTLSPPCENERVMLGEEGIAAGLRLACMTFAWGDVIIKTPDSEINILTRAEVHGGEGDPLYREYGAAVDIGTTTLAANLYHDGTFVASASLKNPQTVCGADVVTRIGRALEGEAEMLAGLIRAALFDIFSRLAADAGIGVDKIEVAVVAGNTAMLSLLTGETTEPLSHAPFAAERLFGEYINLPDLPPLFLLPCVSAFVGADTTAAILSTGLLNGGSAALCDVGTNGEIALWHGGELLCCSTAAGPAFEGGGIKNGTYGVRGAVDRVWYDGDVRFSTIANAPPAGICGSGIVDALALMLKQGIIDETGAFNGADEFYIAPGVSLTVRDVRAVQLAKGAVRAGLETLITLAGAERIDVFHIAGGFGNFLNLENASVIGLIPPSLLPVARAAGNAALAGAAMVLGERANISKAAQIAHSVKTVALDANPLFTQLYMEHMCFNI